MFVVPDGGFQLAEKGTRLAPCDAKALKDLCAGVTWMQRVPPAVLASYRALYVILRGDAADAEEEINRYEWGMEKKWRTPTYKYSAVGLVTRHDRANPC